MPYDYLWAMDVSCSGGWTLSGTPLSLDDPRILSIAEAERQYLDTEYDEYSASSSNGAPFFRSAALIVSPKTFNPTEKKLTPFSYSYSLCMPYV